MKLSKLADKRIFDFVITNPGVADKEGDIVPESEIEEALDRWILNSAPITDGHSNRVIGKGMRFWKDNSGKIVARGLINEGGYADEIWNKIKDGKYKSVSIGGAAFKKTPAATGGYNLNGLDIMEVAVCEAGMHQDANILDKNDVAKHFVLKAEVTVQTHTYADDAQEVRRVEGEQQAHSHFINQSQNSSTNKQAYGGNTMPEQYPTNNAPPAQTGGTNDAVLSALQAIAESLQEMKAMLSAKPEGEQVAMSKTEGSIGAKTLPNPSPDSKVDLENLKGPYENSHKLGETPTEDLNKKIENMVSKKFEEVMKAAPSTTTPKALVQKAITEKPSEIASWEIVKGRKKVDDYVRNSHVDALERKLAMAKEYEAYASGKVN